MAPDDGSPTPGWQARRPMQFKAANVIDLATAIDRPEGLPARRIRLGALKVPSAPMATPDTSCSPRAPSLRPCLLLLLRPHRRNLRGFCTGYTPDPSGPSAHTDRAESAISCLAP